MVGSWVAISGASFGATQGSSTVTFGGVAASIVGWSDTAIFASVPNGLISGQSVPVIVTTTTGTSNPADFLPVSTPAPFQVSPQEVSMLIGQTRTVSVTDSSGNALTGLEWSTSNPSVASLSTDDPPIIAAVAPGTAVIYVLGVPILVTVYSGTSLPPGTSIWSMPVSSSTLPPVAVPAVPSSTGADLLVLDDKGLRALAADGNPVWNVPMTRGSSTQIIPDFSGSAFIVNPSTYNEGGNQYTINLLQWANPSTQQATTLYTFSGSPGPVVPSPTGVVFVQDGQTVNVINSSTQQTIATVSIPDNSTLNGESAGPGNFSGNLIVAGDGNAYIPYNC